jgi:hypothetical protein
LMVVLMALLGQAASSRGAGRRPTSVHAQRANIGWGQVR